FITSSSRRWAASYASVVLRSAWIPTHASATTSARLSANPPAIRRHTVQFTVRSSPLRTDELARFQDEHRLAGDPADELPTCRYARRRRVDRGRGERCDVPHRIREDAKGRCRIAKHDDVANVA